MRRWLPYAAVPVTFAAGLWQKWPCHSAGWPYDPALIFGRLCYSDLPVLYADRGLAEGHFPYATERSFEYPVILGYLADLTARPISTGSAFFLLNLLILLACTLVTVWATVRLTGRDWAGLLVAASPALALTGTINWDMVPVMFVSLAMLAWARRRPALAGLAIGLGTATKLYPALLLFALFVITLRSRPAGAGARWLGRGGAASGVAVGRWVALARAAGVAVVAWAVVNLPVMVLYPQGWAVFWELNSQRQADFGSLFYALDLVGLAPPAALNTVSIVLFGLCLAAVAAFAPPRLETVTLLTVAAFLITNKVYSPQYVLWLLPLAVAAGVPLLMLAAWQSAEVAYWWAVWHHLDTTIANDAYAGLVFVRVAGQLVLCLAALANRELLPLHAVDRGEHPPGTQEVVGGVAVARGA